MIIRLLKLLPHVKHVSKMKRRPFDASAGRILDGDGEAMNE